MQKVKENLLRSTNWRFDNLVLIPTVLKIKIKNAQKFKDLRIQ